MTEFSSDDIFAAAMRVVEEHGQFAAGVAANRADDLWKAGDLKGARKWLKIFEAIDNYQRKTPKPN